MSGSPEVQAAVGPQRAGGLLVFLGVAFAITWAIWLPLLLEARSGSLDPVPWTFFLASAGPAAGALAAAGWEGGIAGMTGWVRRAFSLRVRLRWWLLAIGAPIAYYLVAFSTAALVDGRWPDPAEFGATDKLPGLAWPLVAAVWVLTFGLGEEAGWRGWLLPALMRRASAFTAALVVAAVWIAWHLPAFFFNPTYQDMGPAIVGWMLALVCGSLLLSWMTLGAGGSIVPVLVWHAGFDLLTAADQSAGVIASTVSGIVMTQGAICGWLLWRPERNAGETPPNEPARPRGDG